MAKKTGHYNIKVWDVLIVVVAFTVVIGSYILVKEHDRKNNIAHKRSHHTVGSSDWTSPLSELGEGESLTTDDTLTSGPHREKTEDGRQERRVQLGSRRTERPMGHRPLVCTVGESDLHSRDMIPEDALCDYLFFTHYYRSARGGDTFADDGANKTRAFLDRAARLSRTESGISVTHSNAGAAKRDIVEHRGEKKLKQYWKQNRIYHYGVLDTDFTHFRSKDIRRIQLTFDLLRVFRRVQNSLRRGQPAGKQRRGFIVLGVTPWARTGTDVFKALEKHLKSFSLDGIILRTHLFHNRPTSKFRACCVAPPTSYSQPAGGDCLMGMADVMKLCRKHKTPSWNTSLMVSFTMAFRLFKTAKGHLNTGALCGKNGSAVVLMTNATHACAEQPDYFANAKVDNRSYAMIAHGPGGRIAAYDDGDTVIRKMCAISRDFPDLDVGVAVFDADFQDWTRSCQRNSQAKVKGFRRLRDVHNHYTRTRSKSSGEICANVH